MQSRLHVAVVVIKVVARRCWRSVATNIASACHPASPMDFADAPHGSGLLLNKAGFTAHVVVAGIVAGGLSVAACFSGSELGRLLELGAALAVAVIAVSAVWHAGRRERNDLTLPRVRSLLARTSAELGPLHHQAPAAKVIGLACSPSSLPRLLETELMSRGAASDLAVRMLRKQVFGRVTKAVPVLGSGLGLIDAYQMAVGSMGFVSGFERAALAAAAASSRGQGVDAVGSFPG